MRLLLVSNPRTCSGPAIAAWERARTEIRTQADVSELQTAGGGADLAEIRRLIETLAPEVVVAAGGDGTVGEVVGAIATSDVPAPPALAVLPFGTGNNAARSLGLNSCRGADENQIAAAVETVLRGRERRVDLGFTAGRHFIGSLAIGMDADILVTRNRWQRRFRFRPSVAGYPMYLTSFAANLLFRRHGCRASIDADGAPEHAKAYNLLVLNTCLYAGEFRFDDAERSDDGFLDLLVFRSAADYVRQFVIAWRRHVAHDKGGPVTRLQRLRRVRRLDIQLERPLPAQADGEELAPRDRYRVEVLPRAIAVRTPIASSVE